MQKTILMLGGSRQQVIAIKKAKKLGYRTVLCDYLPDNPGQHEVDVFYQESTTDRDKILEIAHRENVSGVLAYSSDPSSPTAGYVAEKLGLPTNPLRSIEIMSEKHLFRAFLRENGLPCPNAVSIALEDNLEAVMKKLSSLQLPIVIKPTDSSGSKGVSFIKSLDRVEEAIVAAARFSRNGILIAEEYIDRSFPEVIGGDIFVVDGKIEFYGLMTCSRDERLGGLVPVGKKTPPAISRTEYDAVCRVLQDLVQKLHIVFGELNVELLIGKGGVPFILELGSRAGGNMIPVQLSDASGIDLVAANVSAAMGDNLPSLSWSSFDASSACATYVVHSRGAGRLREVSIPDDIQKYIYRAVWYKNRGDEVQLFDGANKAIGILFLSFDNTSTMAEVCARLNDDVCVLLEGE